MVFTSTSSENCSTVLFTKLAGGFLLVLENNEARIGLWPTLHAVLKSLGHKDFKTVRNVGHMPILASFFFRTKWKPPANFVRGTVVLLQRIDWSV